MEKEIRISNNLNEIVVLASFIEELGEELSLPAETVMNINLALEEAVANIIMYAYPPKEQHIILLKVTSTEKQLIFLLTDRTFLNRKCDIYFLYLRGIERSSFICEKENQLFFG